MTIVIFRDYVTQKEFFLRAMNHVPRKDELVGIYYPYTHVTEYLVRQVHWEIVPNELPTVHLDLIMIEERKKSEDKQ